MRALLFALLLLAGSASAEEAVVLSGGGSRGLAHSGALIGIEQRGHDPGLVIGTSMGAVIGALYAAGYEPDSIWSILAREDWRGIFTPIPAVTGPTRALRHPAIHLQRSGGRFILKGFISDWRINRELVRRLFAASARSRGDFDRLPRRYRSVTADLEDGALVSIGFGDLARAARASMASPGFFAPVRWDRRLLIDGGVNDYLPVDDARRLGADFVIAVDALKPPREMGSLDALTIADRGIRLLLVRSRAGSAPANVLVLPDLDPALSPVVYPVDPVPVMRAGLTAALREVPRGGEDAAARALPPAPAALGPLQVETPGSPLRPLVRRAFRKVSTPGYDPERVLTAVDRLYATGLFDGIWPSVEDSVHADEPDFVVRTESESRVSLLGAAGYDNDRGGRIWAKVRGLGWMSGAPVQPALEGLVNGIDQWGMLSLRIPSLGLPTAWSAGGALSESEIPFLAPPVDPDRPEVRRAGGWIGGEWLGIARNAEAAAVFRAERITSDVGPDGGSFGPFVRIGSIPRLVETIGTAPSIEGELRVGPVHYGRARIKGSIARSAGPVSVAILGDAEGASGDVPLDAAPAMGNEFLVPALRWGERRGKARAVGGLDAAYSFPFEGTIRLRLRGGIIADEMRADGTLGRAKTWLGGAGLSGLWWTPYGRVEVGAEAGTLGDRRILVRLGQDF